MVGPASWCALPLRGLVSSRRKENKDPSPPTAGMAVAAGSGSGMLYTAARFGVQGPVIFIKRYNSFLDITEPRTTAAGTTRIRLHGQYKYR